jgi:hypothetical protein
MYEKELYSICIRGYENDSFRLRIIPDPNSSLEIIPDQDPNSLEVPFTDKLVKFLLVPRIAYDN